MRSLSRNLIVFLLAIVGLLVLQAGTSFALHDFSAPDVTADESAGSAKIVITPSCPVDKIEYRTEDGSANAGADYTSVSGTLTSSPWEFEVPILDDSILEGNETVRLMISKFTFPGGAVCVGAHSAQTQLTIRDDEPSSPTAAESQRSAPGSRSKAAVAPAGPSGAPRAPSGDSAEAKSPDRYASDLSNSETLTNSQSTDGPTLGVVPPPHRTRAEANSDRRFPAAVAIGAFAGVSAFALWLIRRRRFGQ